MSQPAKDNSLDSILADFENQYKQKNVSGNNSGNSSDRVNNAPMNNNDPLIDSFVNELTQQKSKPPSQIKSTNTDNNLDNLAQEFQQKGNQTMSNQIPTHKILFNVPTGKTDDDDNKLYRTTEIGVGWEDMHGRISLKRKFQLVIESFESIVPIALLEKNKNKDSK